MGQFRILESQRIGMISNPCLTVDLETLVWPNSSSQLDFYLSRIDQAKRSASNDVTVIGNLLWEHHYPDHDNDLEKFLSQCRDWNINIMVFANDRLREQHIIEHLKKYGATVQFVDYFLYRVYREVIVKQRNSINLEWNGLAGQYLVLTGKPSRLHRVGLLWNLDRAGILDKSIWSLYVPESDMDHTIQILLSQGATPDQAKRFVRDRHRLPDNSPVIFWPQGGSHYGGIPYDHGLYSQSKFRVISETLFEETSRLPWLTEKTWLTMANRCPFIMAGQPGTLDYLESLGYRTFRQYLAIPEYDSLKSAKARMQAIVTNAGAWLQDDRHNREIARDIEHNFQHFVSSGSSIEKDLQSTMQKIMPEGQIDDIVITKDLIAEKHWEPAA